MMPGCSDICDFGLCASVQAYESPVVDLHASDNCVVSLLGVDSRFNQALQVGCDRALCHLCGVTAR